MSRLQPVAGTEIVDDIRLGHTWFEYHQLKQFIQDMSIIRFIEIGIHEGGLVHLLLQDFPNITYLGIELYDYLIRPEVTQQIKNSSYGTLLIKDCFDPFVWNTIQTMPSRKLIYCDGGNKSKEIGYFNSLCKPSDIIMCHDFWDGKRVPRDVPDEAWTPEVLLSDVEHLDSDPTFVRLNEDHWKETRIAGWMKI